ncbi:MAG: right-handed parallel beta-helix repeat-containing protein [Planctomycetia bacterium]|nr:right-handed parallel beta-helix repeat-containing protein [Planctomycetia bacterium]
MKPPRCLAAALVVLGVGTSGAVHAQGGEAPPAPPTYAPLPPTYAVTPDVRYFAGDGVGYRDGYLRLGLFAPAFQSYESWTSFADVRLLLGNRGELGGNFGIGHRYYAPFLDRTLGGYAYFDARDTEIAAYQQLTFGLESLGTFLDARVNGYWPVGRRGHFAPDIEPTGSPFFRGNAVLIGGLRTYEEAQRGVDCRVNANLRALGVDVRPFAGAYAFASDGARDFSGVRGGVQIEPADWAQLRVEVQHDREFGTNVILGVALSYPLGRAARERSLPRPATRLAEPVERFDWLVTGQEKVAAELALTDPRNDAPWVVFHVSNNPNDVTDPNAAPGTFENPFINFAQVRNNAAGEELIYVRGGGNNASSVPYTFVLPNDGQSTAIFTMNGGQLLYGAGIDQPLSTTQLGVVTLAALQVGNPVFAPAAANPGAAAVNMRNRTTVSGITVTSGANGIIASARENLTIRNNILNNQTSRGIDLENIAGNIVVTDNTIQTPGSDAVRIVQTATASNMTISGNTITGVADGNEAYQIDITGSRSSLVMDGNTTTGAGTGIRLRTFTDASVDARFSNNINTSTANNQFPLQINTQASSQINFEVFNNTLRAAAGADGAALSILTTGATAGNQLAGVIRDNDFAAASGQGKGVSINLQGAAVGNMTIRDNLIAGATSGTNVNAHPLLVNTSNTAALNLRVHDNRLSVGTTGDTTAALIQAANTSSIAVLVQDNNFLRSQPFGMVTTGRLALNQGGTSTFSVDYFGVGPAAGTPVVANDPFLLGINTNLGAVAVTGTVLYQPGSTGGAP